MKEEKARGRRRKKERWVGSLSLRDVQSFLPYLFFFYLYETHFTK